MMKKNGFTLAEVLITLAIIGVVATLTLPALMSNTREQQAITGFRKAMNTLNEIVQMNTAVNGFNFSNIDNTDAPDTGAVIVNGIMEQSVWAMLVSNAQVDVTASVDGGIPGECATMHQAFFRDGTALCYAATTTAGVANAVIDAIVDTNGKKAPNELSTCGDDNCESAKNINDQFRITLSAGNALPGRVTIGEGGALDEADDNGSRAARWAMIR